MVQDVIFRSDSKMLISAGMDNLIKFWFPPPWEPAWENMGTFSGHENSVNQLCLSPDEKYLVSSSTDTTVRIWSFPEGDLLKTIQAHKKTTVGIDISADGRYLATSSYDGLVKLFTFPAAEPVTEMKAHAKNVYSVAFTPDDSALVSAGLGDEVYVWSVPEGEVITVLPGHKDVGLIVGFADNGKRLLTVASDGLLNQWNTDDWSLALSNQLKGHGFVQFALSADGATYAAAAPHHIYFFDAMSWEQTDQWRLSVKGVYTVAFSPDGRFLACGAADKKVRIWEIS